MKVTQSRRTLLGRRKTYPISFFNLENIYFTDESIESDVLYADTLKIIKYAKGIRIKARALEEIYYIDIEYGELAGITIEDPEQFAMPRKERSVVSGVLFGWADGLASLHDPKLKIGGQIEFNYVEGENKQQIVLYHGKKDIFDLFKYIRKRFGKYVQNIDGQIQST